MKDITLRADGGLIAKARAVAQSQHKTLEEVFREWLEQFAAQPCAGTAVVDLRLPVGRARSSGPYTRDEMNKR